MIVYSCPEPNLYSWCCTINWNQPTALNDYHREMPMIFYIWTIMAFVLIWSKGSFGHMWQYSLSVIKDYSYIHNHKPIFLMLNTWCLEDLRFLKIKFKLSQGIAPLDSNASIPILNLFLSYLDYLENHLSKYDSNPSWGIFLTQFHIPPFMSLTLTHV